MSSTTLPLVQCCTPLASDLDAEQAASLEQVFKALADRHRVQIVSLLLQSPEPVCVCDLTEALALKQPTVSYHLKQLAAAGLVESERRGTYAYYRLQDGALAGVSALLGS